METENQKENMLTPPIVRCAFKEMVDVSKLCPHPNNPNRHPPKQIEMFIAILQYQGVRRPVTVSKLSGFITKGHGQLEAYQRAGWDKIPVDYQDYDDEQSELADIVADNQLAKLSEMDTGKLKEIGVQLDTGAFNMQLLGIEEAKLEKLMNVVKEPPKLTGADGTPLVGAPGEPNGEGQEELEGQAPSETPATSHVRMVQLFFNDETQQEFMHIVEFFQKQINVDNVTDTVLEVLRAAYRSHTESDEENTETDPS